MVQNTKKSSCNMIFYIWLFIILCMKINYSWGLSIYLYLYYTVYRIMSRADVWIPTYNIIHVALGTVSFLSVQALFYYVPELHKFLFKISDTVIIILQITITGLSSSEAFKASINWTKEKRLKWQKTQKSRVRDEQMGVLLSRADERRDNIGQERH